jgi:hypothetical protein
MGSINPGLKHGRSSRLRSIEKCPQRGHDGGCPFLSTCIHSRSISLKWTRVCELSCFRSSAVCGKPFGAMISKNAS